MTNKMLNSPSQDVTAVLLDIDGTLLDSNDAHAQAWKTVLQRHDRHLRYDKLRPLIGKGGDKLLAEAIGIDAESAEGKLICDERRDLFVQQFLPTLRPSAGARALVQQLRAAGFRLVVATSAGGGESRSLLKQAGIDDLIPQSTSSDDAEASKPDPDIVKAALRKADVGPGNAILLGDTPHDIEAARRAGVRTVALRCGGWWSDDALAGALRIYDDPADLLRNLAGSPLGSRQSER